MMRQRPALTIFLISGRKTYRADLASFRAPQWTSFVVGDLEPGDDLRGAVESLIEADAPLAGRVFVLNSDAWTHIVRLPKAGLKSLPDDELTQALKYEVESLTGLSSEAMEVAHRRLPDVGGEALFWVTVWPEDQCRDVFEMLAGRGARTVVFAHPLGAAVLRDAAVGSSREREEYWPGLRAEFSGARGQLTEIAHGASVVQKWRDAMEGDEAQWQHGRRPIVWGPGGEEWRDQSSIPARDLNQIEQLKQWFWELAKEESADYPRRIWSQRKTPLVTRWAMALIGLAVAAGLSWFHWNWLAQRGKRIDHEIATLEQLIQKLEADDAELVRLAQERDDLSATEEQDGQQLQILQFFLDQQVGRLGKLLFWLLELRTEDLLIRELTPHERGMSIKGMSLNSESAPQLANQLRDRAQPYGWQVALASQIGAKTLVSGGPWEFEIVLEDVGVKSSGATTIDTASSTTWLAQEGGAPRYAP